MRKMFLLAAVLTFVLPVHGQESSYAELLRRACVHEKASIEKPTWFQFLERREFAWGSETRAVIETAEGRLDRLITLNDQPLAPDQLSRQQERLGKLLQDPVALQKEIAAQRADAKRRGLLVSSVPDAFIIQFSNVEPDGRLKFSFTPDPAFSPKNRETQVFRGMRGWLWIDPVEERIVEVHGELFRDVNFGWGILGRLHKGGQFCIVQSRIKPGAWHITTLNLDFKGRLLLFRSLRILHKESSTMFSPSPPAMDALSAIALLLDNYAPPSAFESGEGR